MAPRLSGFTRASSLGPIAEFMHGSGGSIERVLRDVDLPLALIEQPELLLPLREQFRLLERAARETGDEFFGARLGQVVRSRNLSRFGAWVCGGETLREAIRRAHRGLNVMLQTSTVLRFREEEERAFWSIEFVEPETQGRHHNELLGVGYMIDVIRTYVGPRWKPDVVKTAMASGTARRGLEEIFATNVCHGHAVSEIVFDASLLDCALLPSRGAMALSCDEPSVPGQQDDLATIAAVTGLALLEGYPRIDWVAAKLGTTRRSLQRRLLRQGRTFNSLVEDVLRRRAMALLADESMPVTEIAFALGYADPAHFTRAFRRWTGTCPNAHRKSTS